MKVAVYARVSTDSENQLHSQEAQKKYYKRYCDENAYDLVQMYADEGLTGTKLKREQFLNMLYDAGLKIIQDEYGTRTELSKRAPKFEYIIIKDVSRFSRNVDVIRTVRQLRKKKVYVLFEQNSIDTKDEKYEFMLNLFLNFAQQESIDRSMKVKFGMLQRAKDGQYHFSSERLFGYKYDVETKKILTVSHEADIVRRVYDMYVNQLLGSRKIADILNEEGHKTQNDKIWTANGIVRMLKQEKYTGRVHLLKYTYGDVQNENRQKQLKDEDDWILHTDILEPIVSNATYDKAQEIMMSRTTDNRGVNTPKNLFSKKLKCAKCGKNYVRSNQKQGGNTYYFYSCATRRRTKECDNHSVTLKRLEEELNPYQDYKLHEVLTNRIETLNRVIKTVTTALTNKKTIAQYKKQDIQNEINDIQDKITKFVDSLIESSDTVKSSIRRRIEEFENKKKQLEFELLSYDEANIDMKIIEHEEIKKHLNRAVNKRSEFTIEEVLSFVSDIVINGKDIQINFAFEQLLPSDKFETEKDYLIDIIMTNKDSIKSVSEFIDAMK